MTMDEMKKAGNGEILILVDTETSKENVSRAAESRGWKVKDIRMDGNDYHLTIVKD